MRRIGWIVVALLVLSGCTRSQWEALAFEGPPGGRPPPPHRGGRPPPPPPFPPPFERDRYYPPPAAYPAGQPAPTATPEALALRFPPGEKRPDDVAVIIGNGGYSRFSRDLPDVVPARNDAQLAKRYATEALGVPADNVLAVDDATGAQLTRIFGSRDDHRGQLHDMVKPGKSRVFVYYSGHGAPGTRDKGAYLVPVDADAARVELSAYPVTTLLDNLGQLPATEVVVVLEACFSGLSQAGSVLPAASPIALVPKAPRVPANVTLVAAGASDQIASWERDKSHSLFTKYFLLGQSGEADKAPFGNADGTIGWNELQAYLKDTLTHYARRYWGRDQEAQIVRGS